MKPRLALLLLSLTGGGVERATLRLAGELARRGFGVDLLARALADAAARARELLVVERRLD